MKNLLAVFLIMTGVIQLHSQTCVSTLEGEVIDFHDGTPLTEATIWITNTDKKVKTDQNGKFRITGLCDQYYEIEISHPECRTLIMTVNISGNTKQKFTLEHHLEELDEVKVTGKAVRDKTLSSQETTLSEEILERYSTATLGDALKEITGVSSLNTGAAIVKPVIQGLNGSRVLIINNGVRMQDMEWGDEHAPNIDVNAIGTLTVVKGAAALQYGGDAIGGVIIAETGKTPVKDTLYGKTITSLASNGRGSTLTTDLTQAFSSGWYLKGQASIKRFGDFEAPDYVLSNTGVSERGFSLNAGINKFTYGWDLYYSFYTAEIGVLRASHIGNVDDLISAINSSQPLVIRDFTYNIDVPRQDVTHHLARLRYFKRFEELGKWTTQYDFQVNQRLEFDVRIGDDRNKPAIDLELTTHTLSSDFTWDANSDYKINTGIMLRYQNNFPDPATEVRRLIPDYDRFDAGIFVTGNYNVSNDFIVDAGIRYDFNRIDAKKFYLNSRWEERGYQEDFGDIIIEERNDVSQILTNPVFDYHNVSFTTGLQYTSQNNTEWRFNYALSQRAPNPSELFSDGLHHSAARIELGDLRIEQETSHKLAVAISRENTHWGWEIAPYANFISDFILLEPTDVTFTLRGAFPVWEFRQTNARLLGIDASTFVNWHKNWRTEHRLSLVKGNDLSMDIPLINMPAPTVNNRVYFSLEKWNNLRVGLESNYMFRQNETPDDITVFSPVLEEDLLLEINTAPPAAHILGATVDMSFSIFGNTQMEIGLIVNNIINENYRDYLNRLRYFADELGRNFIIQLKFNY